MGTEGDDGRGIRMAQAISASVRNMYAGEVSLPITPPRQLIHGILVNGRGQRFINEDTYMGRVGQSALYGQDGEIYLVVEEAAYEVNWMGLAASWVCKTAEQLESEIGLPPGSLQATVDLYNRHAARGEDPMFHKGHAWVRPLVPARGGGPARRRRCRDEWAVGVRVRRPTGSCQILGRRKHRINRDSPLRLRGPRRPGAFARR